MGVHITQYETLRNSHVSSGGMASTFALRKLGSMERRGLKSARKRANLTQESIAERMGVSVPQISRWENGKDGIPSQRLPSMVKAYQASLEELFDEAELTSPDEARTVMIELLPTFVGAGGGGTGEGDYLSVAFPRSLVEDELRVSPDDLLAIQVEGDSMKPEFLPGDQLLVDKRKTSIAQPGAFCLWDGDGYVVKFIEKVRNSDPPKVLVISENKRYQTTEELAEGLKVMGRVVWIGRRI